MLGDILKWGGKRPDRPGATESDSAARDEPVLVSKGLPKFLTALTQQPSPVLLDFGPVIGTNVEHFGERLGCKLFIEDLLVDIERHTKAGTLDQLPAIFEKRFRHGDASVDGILCWDVFDYLDKKSAKPLADQLVRMLRPDGVLLAFFVTAEPPPGLKPEYTRHVVVDKLNLQHRPYAAARPKQRPLPNRDIQRLFEPLRIVEQFLLKTNLREVLFRKAPEPASTAPVSPSV